MRFTSTSFGAGMPATLGGRAVQAHTGVYRVSTVDGRRTTGVSGLLFLREDRACVLRLAVPTDGNRTLIRLVRGIWWPVALGVKVVTSDGLVSARSVVDGTSAPWPSPNSTETSPRPANALALLSSATATSA